MAAPQTTASFRAELIAYGTRLSGTLSTLADVDGAIEEWLGDEDPEEDLPLCGQWAIFAAATPDFDAPGDPLVSMLLTQWAGPMLPEEQFLDHDEMVQAMEGYPEEFRAAAEKADIGYTLSDDPPRAAAVYSEDLGWVLVRGDEVQTIPSPLDLLAWLAARHAKPVADLCRADPGRVD